MNWALGVSLALLVVFLVRMIDREDKISEKK